MSEDDFDPDQDSGFSSRAVRSGQVRTTEGEQSEPLFCTSSYVFSSAAEAAARFSGETPGNIYSRFTNPTVRTFEQRLASLEGGEACVATASGMSAILTSCLALLKSGDHIVSSRAIFGSTSILFEKYLSRYDIKVTFVTPNDMQQWQDATQSNTRLYFVETPSNPLTELVDIQALSHLAKQKEIILVVDNCFCTPALQRPLELGAHLVIHSATKYIDGQGRCIGGAIVGDKQRVGEECYGFLRTAGPSMSPFNAWVFLKGLETLKIRMQAHCASAMKLAQWLQSHPAIKRVYYPGLDNHPQHQLAKQQQSDFGGIVSFEVEDQAQAWRVIDSVKMISITANLGDAKTTITHPATTTHGRLTSEARQEAGIADGLIRIAVGLEEIQDVMEDLQRGLEPS